MTTEHKPQQAPVWQTCHKHLVTFHVRYGCWMCRNEKKGSM